MIYSDEEAEAIIESVISDKGYSWYDNFNRKRNRRRLQIDKSARAPKVKASPTEKRKLYERQGGKCPWRSTKKDNPHDLDLPISRNEADHVNVNLEGKAYNSLSNKQLLCMVCNREKAAMTIEQIAKHQGLTMEEILAIPHADHP